MSCDDAIGIELDLDKQLFVISGAYGPCLPVRLHADGIFTSMFGSSHYDWKDFMKQLIDDLSKLQNWNALLTHYLYLALIELQKRNLMELDFADFHLANIDDIDPAEHESIKQFSTAINYDLHREECDRRRAEEARAAQENTAAAQEAEARLLEVVHDFYIICNND